MKTAVVTGGSKGIGKETVFLLESKNYKIYELSRTGKSLGNIIHIDTDVSKEESVKNAFEIINQNENGIDLLINNAGFGISGPVEFTDYEDAKKQFDVNFFGTFTVCKYFIPLLRKKRGMIINLSSVAQTFSIPFQSFYSASKSAIVSLSLALANELKPFGIRVASVLPGDVKTGFTYARIKAEEKSDVYGKTISHSVKTMEKDEQNGMSPKKVAKVIVKLAEKKHPKPLTTVGVTYKIFTFAKRFLPTGFVNSVVGKMYD